MDPQVRAEHALSKRGWQDAKALFQAANDGDSLGSTFRETFCTAFSKAFEPALGKTLREIRLRRSLYWSPNLRFLEFDGNDERHQEQ